jgi:hypothetical protein
MQPKPKYLFPVLTFFLVLLLSGSILAQEGTLPLPKDDSASTAEPESGMQVLEETPVSEAVFVNDDFESGILAWEASADVQVVVDENGNSAAELLPGVSLSPLKHAQLDQFKATVWFNLTTLPQQTGYGELKVLFGSKLALTVNTEGLTLAKINQNDQPLASFESPYPNDVWQRLDLTLDGVTVVALVNEVEALRHTLNDRVTRADVPTITPFTLTAGDTGRVLIDDVRLVPYGEPPKFDEPFPLATLELGAPLAFNESKLSGELVHMVQTGDFSAYSPARDGKARISVEIWGVEGISGEALVAVVEAAGGKIETVDFKRVSARLSLEAIANLSLSDQVSVIHLTPILTANALEDNGRALSLNVADVRDPQGDRVTEGFDTTGVQAWHQAGYLGSGVRIAVIDIGFGDPAIPFNNNMVCLPTDAITLEFGSRAAGDSNRGLNMLEVVCDIAPDSEIRLYKAQNTDQLHDAIQAAVAAQNRVIVIGVDLGPNVSPGDGTLGYNSTKNPYIALQAARDAGRVVVAAAGNSRNSYVTFNLTAGAQAQFTVTARPGTPVNLGWNDWDANPNGDGTREDFAASLQGAGIALSKPGRGASNPGYQFIFPAGCTQTAGRCTATLTINGLVGATSTIQIQAGGLDSTITPVEGTVAFQNAGSLARPADSDDVIAVGAVCTSPQANFPITGYSSRGPVYQAGGDYTEITEGPFTGNLVKPEVVAPAQVSTSLAMVNTISACTEGFAGTQAGASHVAGQVAVLLTNPNIGSFQTPSSPAQLVTNILNYLRTHSFDLPFGYDANANGYDMRRGAGVPVLGSPTFNPDTLPNPNTFIIPNRIPAGECAGGLVYVGPYNVAAGNMDGSITRPFNHMSQAIKVASEAVGRCVIALPGEYTSPILVNDPGNLANPVTVFSYASVVRVVALPSTVYVVNSYTKAINNVDKRGAIYVEAESFKFSGFEFIPGVIFASGTLGEPGVLVTDNANGVQFTNNTISGFTTRDLPLIQIVNASQNVFIRGNRFVDNVNASDPTNPDVLIGSMTLISVEDSGAANGRIFIEQNVFRRNKSLVGQWTIDGLPNPLATPLPGEDNSVSKNLTWTSLIRTVDSFTDITSNTFRDNEGKTLIQAVTRLTVAPFETRILGNAMVNNRIASANIGFSPGPLIHLFNTQRIYVVNNTIARNNLLDSGGNGFIVGRGDDEFNNFNSLPNNNNSGSLGSTETRWEFHNNFVVDNIIDNDFNNDGQFDEPTVAVSQVIGDMDAPGVGCRNLAAVENQGAKNNWLWFGASSPGVCSGSFNTPENNNILVIDPYPTDGQYQPTGGVTYTLGGAPEDRFSPAYYALVGSSNDSEPDGIDDGFDSFVDTVLPEFAAGKDARGVNRQNDGDLDNNLEIDLGAYELTPLELANPIELVTQEDAGVVNIELNTEYLTGGFPPYEVTITRYPKYYGVAGVDGSTCDARFTAQARGVAVSFLTDGTPVLSYCPPADFHTATTDPDFVASQVGFDFTISDISSASANSTARFTINPVDDLPLTTVLGDNAPAGDIIDAAVGIGRPLAQNTVRLRPFVDFSGNFVFSERNNTVEPAARDQVDYPFTYGTPTLLADASNQNAEYLVNNLQVVNLGQGKIGFELSAAGEPPGGFAQAKFSYIVQDSHSTPGNVTNIITVRALLPPSPFALLTPPNQTSFSETAEVRLFTWEESTNTQNYLFRLTRTSNAVPEVILELNNLTPAADTDALICAAGSCTLTLTDPQQALVTVGQYEWTVIANNQGVTTTASNAPFTFAVSTGVDLLRNGSFEQPGASNRLAEFWQAKGLDNDKRTCNKVNRPGKPDKIVAFEGECAFQFKGKAGVNSKIQQKFGAFGKAGANVQLTYHVDAKNLQGGAGVVVTLKYTNGEREKIRLDPTTGTYAYTNLTIEQALDTSVLSGKAQIRMRGGSGRVLFDAVKFIYKTDENFELIGPTNNDVYANSSALTKFSWALSVGATSYDVQVNLGTTTVFNTANLSPAQDGDGLTCADFVCRYNLSAAEQAALTGGTYTWQVTAKGGFTTPSTNGPYSFTIDTVLSNLIANFTFEENSNGVPVQWKGKKLGASKVVCDTPNAAAYPAYQGQCAFEFRGAPGYKGKLSQNASTTSVVAGNKLVLSAVAATSGVVDGTAKIDAKIVWSDGTSEKLTVNIPGGSAPYSRFFEERVLDRDVSKIKVTASYRGTGGRLLLDNVQLVRDETP